MTGADTPEAGENRRFKWFVEAGYEGQWHPLKGKFLDRPSAVAHLNWCREHAPESISHQLVRETTMVTLEVEDA